MKTKTLALICFCAGLWNGRSAVVTWDGGGDGISWSDPVNWSGDVAPGSGDDAVLGPGPAVTIAGSYTVLSVQSRAPT